MDKSLLKIAPCLECRELGDYDTKSLVAVRAAFRPADNCVLRQAWRREPERNFMAAVARIGWRGPSLRVFAALHDADIFTQATAPNQRLWELGDVLELFLQPADSPAYVELHVTPNNLRLQLRYPDTAALRRAQQADDINEFILPDGAFLAHTWLEPEHRKWYVHAEIPAGLVGGAEAFPPVQPWRFSFGRYDYTRGRKQPIISSSSPHARPDFHRREEWGTLRFTTRR
jgi:hypothetical protein